MINLDRKDFTKWLNLDTHGCVGFAGEEADCPIARYIRHKGVCPESVNSFEVNESGVFLYFKHLDKPVREPIPNWATEFIKLIDDNEVGTYIGSEEALTAIQQIETLEEVDLDTF